MAANATLVIPPLNFHREGAALTSPKRLAFAEALAQAGYAQEIVKFLVEIICGPLVCTSSNVSMPLSARDSFLPVLVQSLLSLQEYPGTL